jgi:hypothetical protein
MLLESLLLTLLSGSIVARGKEAANVAKNHALGGNVACT